MARLVLALALVALILPAIHGQDVKDTHPSQQWAQSVSGPKLLKHITPNYPPLAKQARIHGLVEVEFAIRKDGKVESVEVKSGHPILRAFTLDSARQDVFRCEQCDRKLTLYRIVYRFELCDTSDTFPAKRFNSDEEIPTPDKLVEISGCYAQIETVANRFDN